MHCYIKYDRIVTVVNNNSSCKKEKIFKENFFGCRGCSAPKGHP